MSKQTKEATPAKEAVVEQKQGAGSIVPYDYGQFAGSGFENQTAQDFAMPFMTVLQGLSPETIEGHEKFIQGARPGMLFNTVSRELLDGKVGIIFVPVQTEHVFVEWIPKDAGGGFVAVHALDSEAVRRAKGKNIKTKGGIKVINPDGTTGANDMVETFYVPSLILANPDDTTPIGVCMLAFTSSKIKVYKKQLSEPLRSFSAKTPIFAHRLRLTSVPDKNTKGQNFFNFKVESVYGDIVKSLIPSSVDGKVNPLLTTASQFLASVRGGEVKIAHEGGRDDTPGDSETADKVF